MKSKSLIQAIELNELEEMIESLYDDLELKEMLIEVDEMIKKLEENDA